MSHEKCSTARRAATAEEIRSLCDHIGSFLQWPLLFLHCKEKVVTFLDHKTRGNLRKCSRSDYELEREAPVHVSSIQMIENRHQWANKIFQIHVRVQFGSGYNENDRLEREFAGNQVEAAVRFGEYWMNRCRFKCEELNVEMLDYPTEVSEIASLPKCTNVRIRCGSEQMFRWWLQKMPKTLENLQLLPPKTRNFEFSSEFLNLPHILNARKLYIAGISQLKDAQFLELKAESVQLESTVLSGTGINDFLKRWAAGGKDPCAVLCFPVVPDQEKVLQDLIVTRWDAEFEKERHASCSRFREFWGCGPTFQVWSTVKRGESVTICFTRSEIVIRASL